MPLLLLPGGNPISGSASLTEGADTLSASGTDGTYDIRIGVYTLDSVGSPGTSTAIDTQVSGSSFVVALTFSNAQTSVSLTDNKGNSYTQIGTLASNVSSGSCVLYYCQDGTGGTGHTWTATFDGYNPCRISAVEILDGATTSVLDQYSDWSTDTSSPYTSGTTSATTQADELALAFYYTDGSATEAVTWGNGFTQIDSELDGFGNAAFAYKRLTSTGTVQSSLTSSGGSTTGTTAIVATFKQAGTAGDITGTADLTEGADTAAGAGELAVSGTGGGTEGADTAAGAGELAVSGAGGGTEGADTAAGAGEPAVEGTADLGETADGISAAGAASITAGGDYTEGADALTGDGASTLVGDLGASEGVDTVAAEGSGTTAGALSSTEGADTAAGAGELAVSGVLSSTDDADTAAGAGELAVSGALSSTDDADTVISSGLTAVTVGELNAGEAADTVAGAGEPAVAGALSSTDAADTAIAEAVSEIAGTLGITEGADTLAASVLGAVLGAVDVLEGTDTLNANAAVGSGVYGELASQLGPDSLNSYAMGIGGSIVYKAPAQLRVKCARRLEKMVFVAAVTTKIIQVTRTATKKV